MPRPARMSAISLPESAFAERERLAQWRGSQRDQAMQVSRRLARRVAYTDLNVRYQPHETFILMVLVMAVQKRGTGIVGYEINFYVAKARHVDGVFHKPGGFLVANLCH
jgi:hypothetical protein